MTPKKCKSCSLALRDREQRKDCVGCEIYEGLKDKLKLETMEGPMLLEGVIMIGEESIT